MKKFGQYINEAAGSSLSSGDWKSMEKEIRKALKDKHLLDDDKEALNDLLKHGVLAKNVKGINRHLKRGETEYREIVSGAVLDAIGWKKAEANFDVKYNQRLKEAKSEEEPFDMVKDPATGELVPEKTMKLNKKLKRFRDEET